MDNKRQFHLHYAFQIHLDRAYQESNVPLRSLKILLDICKLLDLAYTSFVLDEIGSYCQVLVEAVGQVAVLTVTAVDLDRKFLITNKILILPISPCHQKS